MIHIRSQTDWHLSPLLTGREQKSSLPGKGMHMDRMGHSSSDTFWLNFLKKLLHGDDSWISSGFLGSKACKFPGAESPNAINNCKKVQVFLIHFLTHDQPKLRHLIYLLMTKIWCQLLVKCFTSLQTPCTLHLVPLLHASSPQSRATHSLPIQIMA